MLVEKALAGDMRAAASIIALARAQVDEGEERSIAPEEEREVLDQFIQDEVERRLQARRERTE